jgi:hypothetical protein
MGQVGLHPIKFHRRIQVSNNEDWINLYEVKFSFPRKQIGNCRFSSGGQLTTELKSLTIMKHKDDTNVYLLYKFVNGSNDSYLGSIEEAMAEAEEQFGVESAEWKKISNL